MPDFYSSPSATLKPSGMFLRTYDPFIQQYGTFFSAFPWQAYCTGTYRRRKSLRVAQETFRKFIRMLDAKLKCRVAYVAVHERTTSGLGKPPGPWHWHFVLCGPDHKQADLLLHASAIWEKLNGNAHVLPYDHRLYGGRYLAKTACHVEFEYECGNLDMLTMPSTLDLFEHQQIDPYVPDHVRHVLTGRTLTLRSPRAV